MDLSRFDGDRSRARTILIVDSVNMTTLYGSMSRAQVWRHRCDSWHKAVGMAAHQRSG